jgi:alpha-tubulin suppressor-like RCC1 family protein
MPHIGCTMIVSGSPARRFSPILAMVLVAVALGCREDAESPVAPDQPTPALAPTAAQVLSFRQVSAGWYHTCAVTTDNRAYCWGLNRDGELGDGTTNNSLTPVPVAGTVRFLQVSAGTFHACGVATDDRTYCWGFNGDGQLGDGTTTNHLTPVAGAGGRHFHEVRAGYRHTCGVTMAKRAYCWGSNSVGQLGDGTTTNRLSPVAVTGGHHFRQVIAGNEYTCGATMAKRAYCWGLNAEGQLGDGTAGNARRVPVAVAGGLRFRQVIAGRGSHTCGVTIGGRAYCWGRNKYGQLGDGTEYRPLAPVAVVGELQFNWVAPGGEHTCGVTTGSLAYCWGWNYPFGTLGNGTTNQSWTPVAVAGGLHFGYGALSAGLVHTCGVTTGAGAYCWGGSPQGQLGDGTTSIRTTPVPIPVPVAGGT